MSPYKKAIERDIEDAMDSRLHNPSAFEAPDYAQPILRRLDRLEFVDDITLTPVGGGMAAVDFDLIVPGMPEGSIAGPTEHFRDLGLTSSGIVLREREDQPVLAKEFLLRLPSLPPVEEEGQDADAVEAVVNRLVRQNNPPTELSIMIAEDTNTITRNLAAYTPHVGYESVTTPRRPAEEMVDFTNRVMQDFLDLVMDGPVGIIT